MNKKVNNLSDLFKSSPKKDKKSKKKIEKEKNINENNDDKLRYYFPLINNNDKDNNNKMIPTFLNNEKIDTEFDFEQEIFKNSNTKNITNIDFDNYNSGFNFDFNTFFKNDEMDSSLNNNEEYSNLEDMKEGEDINHYVNKSLMENIDNPDLNEGKEEGDSSRFFQFDFFKEKNE